MAIRDIINKAGGLGSSLAGMALDAVTGGMVGKVGRVVEQFTMPAADKVRLQEQIAAAIATESNRHHDLLEKHITASVEMALAEVKSSDPWVRRMRPLCIPLGFLMVGMAHLIWPALGWAYIALPEEFYWVWGSVSGAWVVSRGAEKLSKSNKITKLITGE